MPISVIAIRNADGILVPVLDTSGAGARQVVLSLAHEHQTRADVHLYFVPEMGEGELTEDSPGVEKLGSMSLRDLKSEIPLPITLDVDLDDEGELAAFAHVGDEIINQFRCPVPVGQGQSAFFDTEAPLSLGESSEPDPGTDPLDGGPQDSDGLDDMFSSPFEDEPAQPGEFSLQPSSDDDSPTDAADASSGFESLDNLMNEFESESGGFESIDEEVASELADDDSFGDAGDGFSSLSSLDDVLAEAEAGGTSAEVVEEPAPVKKKFVRPSMTSLMTDDFIFGDDEDLAKIPDHRDDELGEFGTGSYLGDSDLGELTVTDTDGESSGDPEGLFDANVDHGLDDPSFLDEGRVPDGLLDGLGSDLSLDADFGGGEAELPPPASFDNEEDVDTRESPAAQAGFDLEDDSLDDVDFGDALSDDEPFGYQEERDEGNARPSMSVYDDPEDDSLDIEVPPPAPDTVRRGRREELVLEDEAEVAARPVRAPRQRKASPREPVSASMKLSLGLSLAFMVAAGVELIVAILTP